MLSNRHPNIDIDEFNDRYLNPSLEMSSKASKSIFMFGDFNRDLLKHDYHAPTNEFPDSLTSMFLPPILQPTRVSSSSKTLIDNSQSRFCFRISQFFIESNIFYTSLLNK